MPLPGQPACGPLFQSPPCLLQIVLKQRINAAPQRLSQKEIAALCFLSESSFRHRFRRQMHMSFQEYVAKLRYLDARRRIAAGEGSIADAVRDAGFSNPYRFYQMFQENEGVTPLVWRTRLRAEAGSAAEE